MASGELHAFDAESRRLSASWLLLATAAVAVSGLFAILIALARVPALGQLFPGAEFYRIALTLHVSLSQGVWFLAFAGLLWTLAMPRRPGALERGIWLGACVGAAGIALSVAAGEARPIMSNYVPVLDSPWFLGALLLFGAVMLLKALAATADLAPAALTDRAQPTRALLTVAALTVLVAGAVLLAAHHAVGDQLDGHAYFEMLFWGPGHIWQFALTSLMAACWLDLSVGKGVRPVPARLLVLVAILPVLAAALVALMYSPLSSSYSGAFTWLMRWTSWQMPLLMAWAIFPSLRRADPIPGIRLSMALFIVGLLVGASIRAETTLVTAHYHGTIGAVTLAFMAYGLACLPRLGADEVPRRQARLQLGLYGYGILLMIAGLAGAGLMGAPRKTPGALEVLWNVETISRILLGLGGLLATAGILLFAVLVIPRLIPSTSMTVLSR